MSALASAEVIRHALEQQRVDLARSMRQLVLAGDRESLHLMLCLIDGTGHRYSVAWHQPPTRESVHRVVTGAGAVAGVLVSEFQRDAANLGTAAACLHWSYPQDLVTESCFYILDGEDLAEFPEGSLDIGACVHTWVDEILGAALTP